MKGWIFVLIAPLVGWLLSACAAPPTPPPSGADLVITESANRTSITLAQNITLTITVTNRGPSSASQVVFGDELPAPLKLISAACSSGSLTGHGFCELELLPSGESAVNTVIATAVPDPGLTSMKLTTRAMISGYLAFDPNLNNNSVSVPLEVIVNTTGKVP
jgi:uncharacterized repeat protein (TIGR01451 family)